MVHSELISKFTNLCHTITLMDEKNFQFIWLSVIESTSKLESIKRIYISYHEHVMPPKHKAIKMNPNIT